MTAPAEDTTQSLSCTNVPEVTPSFGFP